VLEYRPKGWHKGNAVTFILALFAFPCSPLPVYIGDDATDEDAFRSLNDYGVTIKVSPQIPYRSVAHYHLNSPSEVHQFLDNLATLRDKQKTLTHLQEA